MELSGKQMQAVGAFVVFISVGKLSLDFIAGAATLDLINGGVGVLLGAVIIWKGRKMG